MSSRKQSRKPGSRARRVNNSFSFSADAVEELKHVLGSGAEALISQLEGLVREHQHPSAKAQRSEWSARAKRPYGTKQRRQLIAALRNLIRRIDEAEESSRAPLTLTDLMDGGKKRAARWLAFRNLASDHLREMESQESASRRKPGRPKDMERASLALDVAVVLRLGGVSVKTSRTGALAKVLATVLHEMYGSAPDDMFRTIQAVAAFVDRPISEVRRSVEEAAGFSVDGDYWVRLLAVQ